MSHGYSLQLLDRHLAAENAHDLNGTLATRVDDCEFIDDTLGVGWRGHDGAAAHYTMLGVTAFGTVADRGEVRSGGRS